MTTHETYGCTGDGTPIDEAFINPLADKAERNYTPKPLKGKPHDHYHPPLGDRVEAV